MYYYEEVKRASRALSNLETEDYVICYNAFAYQVGLPVAYSFDQFLELVRSSDPVDTLFWGCRCSDLVGADYVVFNDYGRPVPFNPSDESIAYDLADAILNQGVTPSDAAAHVLRGAGFNV